jgi:hypothetical protein
MKRTALLLIILALAAAPLFSQLRLDIGVDVPKGVGAAMAGNSIEIPQETIDFFNQYFFPFPEAALHYQFDFGIVKLGVGVRAFTLILETALWPNAFAEVNLGPVAIEAQIGGGLFAFVGLANSIETGNLFFPDLSVWYKIGKKQLFRLGGGVMGFYLPELASNGMAFAFYLGGKVALPL